ncbi:hypothetical protein B0H15DRAFT_928134 [Mycena belliarum]|nr:hypothetical protein B0H15DRAFT_928134 [Mycena belliae]
MESNSHLPSVSSGSHRSDRERERSMVAPRLDLLDAQPHLPAAFAEAAAQPRGGQPALAPAPTRLVARVAHARAVDAAVADPLPHAARVALAREARAHRCPQCSHRTCDPSATRGSRPRRPSRPSRATLSQTSSAPSPGPIERDRDREREHGRERERERERDRERDMMQVGSSSPPARTSKVEVVHLHPSKPTSPPPNEMKDAAP